MGNIDINENTRSGQGTTHVPGSLIFQISSRQIFQRQPVLTHRQDLRRKPVKYLETTDVLECPNKGEIYCVTLPDR